MPEPLTKEEVLSKIENDESLVGLEIGNVDFRNHHFKQKVDFTRARFTGSTNFEKAQFLNDTSFFKAKFSGETNFSATEFASVADFSLTTFSGEKLASFTKAIFSVGVSFALARFLNKGGVSFQLATFAAQNTVLFVAAQFHNGASFGQAHFSGKRGVNFEAAQFLGEGQASFANAKFTGDEGANFSMTSFSNKEGIYFNNAQFWGPGKVRFENTSFNRDTAVFFEKVDIDSIGNLQFVDTSLCNVLFRYTDLEKIYFNNVQFIKTQNRLFNREYLADEDRNKFVSVSNKTKYNQKYYIQVEILYRKLKLNFETQLDFHRAGDFHYGELEMRRKAKMLEWEEKSVSKYLPFLKYLNLTQFYKIVSGYGEKWVQALASFVAVWLVFTSLNLFWVEPKVTMPQEQPARMEQWEKDPIHRLGGSALFSFKVLTLQRWGDDFQLKGASYFPRFFVAVQHLIGPTIIALMLLAIRRQFRR